MTSRETFLITASSEDRKMTRSLSNYKVVMMLMYALVVRLPRRRSRNGDSSMTTVRGTGQRKTQPRPRLAQLFHVKQCRAGFPVAGRHAQQGTTGVGAL